jgi:hypothetical protein
LDQTGSLSGGMMGQQQYVNFVSCSLLGSGSHTLLFTATATAYVRSYS